MILLIHRLIPRNLVKLCRVVEAVCTMVEIALVILSLQDGGPLVLCRGLDGATESHVLNLLDVRKGEHDEALGDGLVTWVFG